MNIDERIESLKNMLSKQANTTFTKSKSLFPKLKGPNKPPVLTSEKIDTQKIRGVASLPEAHATGKRPAFTSEMKDNSPYRKQ